jgi:hypothetical protein
MYLSCVIGSSDVLESVLDDIEHMNGDFDTHDTLVDVTLLP